MSDKSTVSKKKNKPSKPYEGFPLFPHANGYWAKKILKKLHYFGPWGDPDNALKKYLDQKDALHAGRKPRTSMGGLSIMQLSNRFLTSKQHLVDSEELSLRTFGDYYRTCNGVINHFGKDLLIDDIEPEDFEQFRAALNKTRGPVALGNEIQRVRSLFKYAFDAGLIKTPVLFGPGFKRPSRRVVRKARHASGERMFEADELRKILDAANQPLRAMVLLGLNCAFGQSDLSNLPESAFDFETGWVKFPRPKTEVQRRCPLWPETIESVKDAIGRRPKPKDKADSNLVFVTKYGHRWVKLNKNNTPDDAIGKEFAKLLRQLELKRPRINFYAIRHTFETIAGESKDQVAVSAVMGHADDSMAAAYRERISDERLIAVTDTVHKWLFSK